MQSVGAHRRSGFNRSLGLGTPIQCWRAARELCAVRSDIPRGWIESDRRSSLASHPSQFRKMDKIQAANVDERCGQLILRRLRTPGGRSFWARRCEAFLPMFGDRIEEILGEESDRADG